MLKIPNWQIPKKPTTQEQINNQIKRRKWRWIGQLLGNEQQNKTSSLDYNPQPTRKEEAMVTKTQLEAVHAWWAKQDWKILARSIKNCTEESEVEIHGGCPTFLWKLRLESQVRVKLFKICCKISRRWNERLLSVSLMLHCITLNAPELWMPSVARLALEKVKVWLF